MTNLFLPNLPNVFLMERQQILIPVVGHKPIVSLTLAVLDRFMAV